MDKKKVPTRTGGMGRWFVPGGIALSLRTDLLPLLKQMHGRTPLDIARWKEATEEAPTWEPMFPGEEMEAERAGVSIVSAIGPLTQYEGPCDWLFGTVPYSQIAADMEAAAADISGAILLIVDGPGGVVAGNADLADRIREISETIKPVVCYSPAEACSASYALFCAGSKTMISQTAMVGCIGTVWTWLDDSKAQEEIGVREIEFVSESSPDKRPDPTASDGKAVIQATVDELGAAFVAQVARMRGVADETVRNDFGKGWVLIGANAVAAGLADSVGTLSDAILLAQELAGSAGDSTPGAIPTISGAAGNSPGADGGKPAMDQEIQKAIDAERARISGILAYNTPSYRSFAAAEIDAAINDSSITAEKLAKTILDKHSERLAAVAAARAADGAEVPAVPTGGATGPPGAATTTATTPSGEHEYGAPPKLPDANEVYASFNKQAGAGCNKR